MGRLYSDQGDQAVGTLLTLWTLQSATTIKPEIQDMNVGCGVAPADAATRFNVYRFTSDDGTGTTGTEEPNDPDDPASLALIQTNHSGEPSTKGGILLEIPLHQRATFRHVMAPGRGWKINNVATEGLGFQSAAATATAEHRSSLTWEE